MAKRNLAEEKIELEGLPKEIIAGVIIAQMYQAQSDAKTHPDRAARERIITATNLVLDLLKGYTSAQVVAAIPQIQAIFASAALPQVAEEGSMKLEIRANSENGHLIGRIEADDDAEVLEAARSQAEKNKGTVYFVLRNGRPSHRFLWKDGRLIELRVK